MAEGRFSHFVGRLVLFSITGIPGSVSNSNSMLFGLLPSMLL